MSLCQELQEEKDLSQELYEEYSHCDAHEDLESLVARDVPRIVLDDKAMHRDAAIGRFLRVGKYKAAYEYRRIRRDLDVQCHDAVLRIALNTLDEITSVLGALDREYISLKKIPEESELEYLDKRRIGRWLEETIDFFDAYEVQRLREDLATLTLEELKIRERALAKEKESLTTTIAEARDKGILPQSCG
ncbi:MAG: hypothetical protein HN411_02585 [Waddliaceae bacterium]|jgi:hypothetical protein|nr:hypothetical protein [Waddliaceae bacterium]MBT3578700.1 hypothetical protein [Waddliaceae bacterium]MBT4444398.1 hypothetical protein [Waddliaceae bacterium]MBT6928313.1 hypothetical protein [Waddliaceae bacterium]MBT7264999.1 hypothetical protein [Waddliaceae bacterium]